MRTLVFIVFWFQLITFFLRIVSLCVEEYPRPRKAVSVGAESAAALINMLLTLICAAALWR